MAAEIDDNGLRLLMDSYREQIQLNTKLLERQERFIENLDKSTQELVRAIDTQTKGLQNALSLGFAGLSEKNSKEHGDINIRIYVALGGMVSILVTLITLWAMK